MTDKRPSDNRSGNSETLEIRVQVPRELALDIAAQGWPGDERRPTLLDTLGMLMRDAIINALVLDASLSNKRPDDR